MTTKRMATTAKPAITVFGSKPIDSIFLPQVPFVVRNDCMAAQWKVGDGDARGKEIEISIIKVSQCFGTLGKAKDKLWLQIWFVAAPSAENLPQNTVCLTHIKTRSISAFSSKVTELMQLGEPALGIFKAGFEKHSGESGNYYSVTWDWRERNTEAEHEQLDKIAAFLQTQPALVDVANHLICVDGMSAEEIGWLMRSSRAIEPAMPQHAAVAS